MDIKRKESMLPIFYIGPLLLMIVYLFGNRGKDIGADSATYASIFQNADIQDFGIEFLNAFLFTTIGSVTYSYQILFIVYSVLFVLVYTISLKRLSDIFNANFALVIFSAICIFTFKNMGVNIMRQGVSLSFFLLGLSFYIGKSKWAYLFFVISIGFHTTSAILLVLVFLQRWIKNMNINILFFCYGLAIVLSFFSIGIKTVASFVDLSVLDEKRAEGYLNTTYNVYETGFKLNFVVFNTIFLAIFNFIRKTINDENYNWLLRLFITTSVVFFFMFEIPFSDRWGLFSWILIPILISPVFSINFKYRLATITTLFLILIFVVFEYIMWN
ncbi:EpsG family protein [Sphingobacterium hungaricum]